MDILLNKCYGGYGISKLALERIVELDVNNDLCYKKLDVLEVPIWLNNKPISNCDFDYYSVKKSGDDYYLYKTSELSDGNIKSRCHPIILEVFKELGSEKFSSDLSEIELCDYFDFSPNTDNSTFDFIGDKLIITLNIDYNLSHHIHDHDGIERLKI